MTADTTQETTPDPTAGSRPQAGAKDVVPPVNEVTLCGRLSSAPTVRELPSGSQIVTFRLVVPRTDTVMTKGSRQKSDWVECAAWSSLARRRAVTWRLGDVVQVSGALRRRHYGGDRAGSALDVEMLGGRVVRRAPTSQEGGGRVQGSSGAGSE